VLNTVEALTLATVPTFTWTPVAGADHYDLYVNDVTTGQPQVVIHESDLTGTSFMPSPSQVLTVGHTYTWYVGAVSADGSVDVFSQPLTFLVQPVVKTFATGFSNPAALAFDAAGNLYVGNNGVIDMVNSTGVVTPFVTGFAQPSALAFDTAGDLYWTEYGGTLNERTPAGVVTQVASGFYLSNALAIDAAGNLYVNDYDYDGAGDSLVIKVTPAGAESVFAYVTGGIGGLAFDAAGNLYIGAISQSGNGYVDKVTPDGQTVTLFASGFAGTRALAFDASGNLYVENEGTGTVSVVTPAGAVSTYASGFSTPIGMAFDAAGNLYVANYFTPTGATVNNTVSEILTTTPNSQPTVTPSTAYLSGYATSLIIQGSGFSSAVADDTVTFSNGATGTVTSASTTQLTVSNLTGLVDVDGDLFATVTVSGPLGFLPSRSSASVQVATVFTT